MSLWYHIGESSTNWNTSFLPTGSQVKLRQWYRKGATNYHTRCGGNKKVKKHCTSYLSHRLNATRHARSAHNIPCNLTSDYCGRLYGLLLQLTYIKKNNQFISKSMIAIISGSSALANRDVHGKGPWSIKINLRYSDMHFGDEKTHWQMLP